MGACDFFQVPGRTPEKSYSRCISWKSLSLWPEKIVLVHSIAQAWVLSHELSDHCMVLFPPPMKNSWGDWRHLNEMYLYSMDYQRSWLLTLARIGWRIVEAECFPGMASNYCLLLLRLKCVCTSAWSQKQKRCQFCTAQLPNTPEEIVLVASFLHSHQGILEQCVWKSLFRQPQPMRMRDLGSRPQIPAMHLTLDRQEHHLQFCLR